MKYFFILGRNPELSLAELRAILPSTQYLGGSVAIVETEKLDVDSLMKRLGGTIKIGEITHQDILNLLEIDPAKKVYLGISAYSTTNAKTPNTYRIGIEAKRTLQKSGHKVRLVTSKLPALSSVIVKREKLLKQGAEIVLIYDKGNVYTGKTVAVQEFEQASRRDYGRPNRTMKIGMIPIQLAKIMINLSGASAKDTLLDPFCGFGTILSEAMLMGYRNLIGSDIDFELIKASEQNLNWVKKEFSLEKFDIKLFQSPAQELSKYLNSKSIDIVVTEPHMGSTSGITSKDKEELENLYLKTFEEFKKIIKTNGKVVFIFPYFKTLGKTSDSVLPKIKKLGFEPTIDPLIYSRENQKVLREIFVLALKK